jgi:hypothetical protein
MNRKRYFSRVNTFSSILIKKKQYTSTVITMKTEWTFIHVHNVESSPGILNNKKVPTTRLVSIFIPVSPPYWTCQCISKVFLSHSLFTSLSSLCWRLSLTRWVRSSFQAPKRSISTVFISSGGFIKHNHSYNILNFVKETNILILKFLIFILGRDY